LTELPWLF